MPPCISGIGVLIFGMKGLLDRTHPPLGTVSISIVPVICNNATFVSPVVPGTSQVVLEVSCRAQFNV